MLRPLSSASLGLTAVAVVSGCAGPILTEPAAEAFRSDSIELLAAAGDPDFLSPREQVLAKIDRLNISQAEREQLRQAVAEVDSSRLKSIELTVDIALAAAREREEEREQAAPRVQPSPTLRDDEARRRRYREYVHRTQRAHPRVAEDGPAPDARDSMRSSGPPPQQASRGQPSRDAAPRRESDPEANASTRLASHETAAEPWSPGEVAWRDLLLAALEDLEYELRETADDTVRTPLATKHERWRLAAAYRLIALAANEDLPPPLTESDKHLPEYWGRQVAALKAYLDPQGSPDWFTRSTDAAERLREATDALAEAALLKVRNLHFVTKVTCYGVYEPFPRAVFKPGQEVLLYAEFDNFASEKSGGGYRTVLKASYLIDRGGGNPVRHEFGETEDWCAERRRDFFIPFRLRIPELTPGKYRLMLTVEDVVAEKFGQEHIDFEVIAGR